MSEEERHTQSQELDVTTLEAALKLILAMGEIILGIGGEDGAQLCLLGAGAIVLALEVLHVAHVACEEDEDEVEEEKLELELEKKRLLSGKARELLVTRIIMG